MTCTHDFFSPDYQKTTLPEYEIKNLEQIFMFAILNLKKIQYRN